MADGDLGVLGQAAPCPVCHQDIAYDTAPVAQRRAGAIITGYLTVCSLECGEKYLDTPPQQEQQDHL